MPRTEKGHQAEAQRKAAYHRKRTASDADIAPIPECELPELREACRHDLELWHTEVFPCSTGLKPFGDVQKLSVEQSRVAIIHGGRAGKAEPRGYGKSTRACNEALWAALYNYRQFILLIGASMPKAQDLLAGIRDELISNEILFKMFPEVCYPFHKLEGIWMRGQYQHVDGKPTDIRMKGDLIVFPNIHGFESACNKIAVKPLKNARGTQYRYEGTVYRPDFVILDDIQTDEDAESPTTVEKIVNVVKKSVLRLGGHNKTLSAINCCTVIQEDDASERLLNDPSWQSVRYKMLVTPSENEEMWLGTYADIRRDFDDDDPSSKLAAQLNALEFYRSNREEMDLGATVSWEWAFAWDDEPQTEISAIQHAYNILIDDGEAAFRTECQNDPIRKFEDTDYLTAEEITLKCHSGARGRPPLESERLIAGIDVQKEVLYWQVWAYDGVFGAYLVDYGTYPDQKRVLFEKKALFRKLSQEWPTLSSNARTYKALNELSEILFSKSYLRMGDQEEMFVSRLGVDCGYRDNTVQRFWRDSKLRDRIILTRGVGYGAKTNPMSERTVKSGERKGAHWFYSKPKKRGEVRKLEVDTNFWKTFHHQGLALDIAEKGSISLFDVPSHLEHRLLANHYKAEYPETVAVKGRQIEEWEALPTEPDNDHFDVSVICHCLASFEGVTSIAASGRSGSRRRKVNLSSWEGV